MRTDVRGTPTYRAVEQASLDWLRVGSGQVAEIVDAALSPDGRTIAAAGVVVDELVGTPRQRLCLVDVATGALKLVSDSPRTDRKPVWSPDGRTLAFLSDRTRAGDFQLQLMEVASGEIRAAALDQAWVEYALWSPDGRHLLLGAAGAGADLAGAQGGVRAPSAGEDGLPDWAPKIEAGPDEGQWRSLWLHDPATGAARRLSPTGVNVWEAAWCGPGAVIGVASDAPGEETWYGADLRRIDLATGAVTRLYQPKDQIGWISASPSGARIALAEAVCSDRTIVAGELLAGPADGSLQRIDTDGVDVTFTAWQGEDALLYAGQRSFETVLGLVEHGERREIWRDAEITFGNTRYPEASPAAAPGDAAVIIEGHFQRPALAVIEAGRLRTVREFGSDGLVQRVAGLGKAEARRWTAPDGLEIHGWLLAPPGPGPHPLVMDIHGGPVWMHRQRFVGRPSYPNLLLARGYAVLQPNVRGSSGRGQAYARQVFGDMGGADTFDYLSGLDALVAEGVADPARLGVTGGSYGGFMSSWLITQDDRFAAAVPIAPVTDWVSEHLTCHIPHFCEMFLADALTNPGGKYFTRSPIMFAGAVKTPTLVICGALDQNTPPGQALEFHHALRLAGAESVLLTYPKEGHGVRTYPAAVDFAARLIDWFEAHMPAR